MSYMRTNKRENPYVQVDKTFIEDESLSWGAKGLMAYILSRPDNWQIRRNDLEKRSADKRDKVENYIYELMAAGYIYYFPEKDEETHKIKNWIYEVYESPEFNDKLEESIAKGKEMIQNKKDRNKKKSAKRKESNKSPDVEIPHVGKNTQKPDVEFPHEEVPHVEIPPFNNNKGSNKNDLNKIKIDNLSIQDEIKNTDLPYELKQMLAEKIDRLIVNKISVFNILTNYKLYKDTITDWQYISALEYALRLDGFTSTFADVMAKNVKKQLEFAKDNAQTKNEGQSQRKTVRKELVPDWLKAKKHLEKQKEEAEDPDFEEVKRKLKQELEELHQELKTKNNQPKQPTPEEIEEAEFEAKKAELAKKLAKYA